MYNRRNLSRFVSSCIAIVALFALPLAGCGDDNSDPVPGACKTACQIESTDVCYTQQTQCESDCEGIGRDAQLKGFKPDECALCQVGLVGYSRAPDNSKCWGVIRPTDFANATCNALCIDPNGP